MARIVSLSTLQLTAVITVAVIAGGVGAMMVQTDAPPSTTSPQTGETAAVDTFESPDDFRSYLQTADHARPAHLGLGDQVQATGGATTSVDRDGAVEREGAASGDDAAAPPEPVAQTPAPASTDVPDAADDGTGGSSGGSESPRASDTNVQVEGIDEPDILKTTSNTLYYSAQQRGPQVRPGDDRPDSEDTGGVHLIDADDPAAPEVASELDVSGELLVSDEMLVVFEQDRLIGYDIADRENPEQTWTKELSDRVVTARLHAGTIYLVTADDIDRNEPCPVRPMEDVSVPCAAVHHPVEPVPVDTTYSVSLIDPADGEVADTASFVGTTDGQHRGPGSQTVVYVSADRVYIAYPKPIDEADVMAEFLLSNQSDRLDAETIDRIEEIQSYDLSPQAKRIEIQRALETWRDSLEPEERREAEQAFRDDREAWMETNKRNIVQTGIVAFNIQGVETAGPSVEAGATGSVPGYALNQFSLDEHDDEFRIATTIPRVLGGESENDLYVLDDSLNEVGAVQGMGITERIYSVRYVGDEAYVVTFRQIDPFHVVDLSDSANPTVEGELKLPGFSSYLHPLSEDRILGIGEEDRKVKLVVFDVSDPTDPTIEEDRILDARWSGVADNHHAFLLDERHEVFFLPTAGPTHPPRPLPEDDDGGGGDRVERPPGEGYIFSYEDGLTVETTIETTGRPERASYIGDYLYVFDDSSVTVVDEHEWEETTTVTLSED